MSKPKFSLAVVRLGVLGVLIVGAAIAIAVIGTDGISNYLEDAAASQWGVVAFMALYIVGVVLMVPGTLGTLTSGAVFGFAVGFPAAFFSALIGATLSFVISRAVGKEGMAELLGDRMKVIDDWLGDNDFVSILILRLMPIVPFNGLNYAAGITSVRFSRYVAATALGIAPGTALSAAAASMANEPSSAAFLLVAAGLIAITVISTVFARRFTRSKNGS